MSDERNEELAATPGMLLTRRAFIARAATASALAGAALVYAPARLLCADWPAAYDERRGAVATFFMDRLYLDTTGRAQAYRPPAGARSAAPVEDLSEEEFRRRHVYV
ncbi:MAG: hypothetical protein LAN59_02530 [Acidobacteriia bacterium]|nr:hypothetical protein [Terriglobia bacterium]